MDVLRRGPKATMPVASIDAGELVVALDTEELFLGLGTGQVMKLNVNINDTAANATEVWSAAKTKAYVDAIPASSGTASIDDATITATNVWSASKVNTLISGLATSLSVLEGMNPTINLGGVSNFMAGADANKPSVATAVASTWYFATDTTCVYYFANGVWKVFLSLGSSF
jgi:hypothetical protein